MNQRFPFFSGGIWSMLAPYLSGSWKALLFAVGINALHGIGIAVQNVAPKYLLDDVLLREGLSLEQRYLWLAGFVVTYLVASLIGRMLVWHISYRIFAYVREALILKMRSRFFRHINALCMRFHNRHNSGELYSYLFGSPIAQVQLYLQQFAMSGPGAFCTLLFTLIWVGFWDLYMTAALAASVLSSVLIMNHARQKIQSLHKEFQSAEATITGRVADLIRGTREVKLYAVENQIVSDFHLEAEQMGKRSIRRDILSHLQFMKQESCSYLFFVLLCCLGAWRFLHHGLTGGELLAYLGCFTALQGPLQQIFQIGVAKGSAMASLERIQVVLDTASTTPDPVEAVAAPTGGHAIHFEHVTFSYATRPNLIDFNLTIPYGQRIALVGPSGAGKSTVVQLLLRLYDPQAGTVRLGETPLSACRGADVRKLFGVVPQAPYFFQASIRENLLLVRPDATQADIIEACQRAHAWEFIEKLPDGLDTPMSEGGSTLSGGQRQRLAIARVLLFDPPFFIFDEATSALDTVSERLIDEALQEAIRGRTAIFIAHRLSTIRSCDRILVLQDGQIRQDGRYDALAAVPGIFRDLLATPKD